MPRGTEKQQRARKHNWVMYNVSKNKNQMHTIINLHFTGSTTITDESKELTFKVIEAQAELLRSLVHRKE